MRYIVWCRVSGGVTGHREAPLKENGQTKYFDDKFNADEKANTLNRTMNHKYATASYRYTVVPE